MMADAPNRAERRARIFPRAPSPKAQPSPGPNPEAMQSQIRPLKDAYDSLMELGEVRSEVPFATRDEDLTKPQAFVDTAVAYIAEFDKQRCERCGGHTNVFSRLLEQRGSGKEVLTYLFCRPGLPINPRFTGNVQYVPIGACCAFKEKA